MNQKEKTNIAMLWIAILVLMVTQVFNTHRDYQSHQQIRQQQEVIQQNQLQIVENQTELIRKMQKILDVVEALEVDTNELFKKEGE